LPVPFVAVRVASLQHDILELKKQLEDARSSGKGGEDNFGNILNNMRADHDKVGEQFLHACVVG
jgi:hypothetical protein